MGRMEKRTRAGVSLSGATFTQYRKIRRGNSKKRERRRSELWTGEKRIDVKKITVSDVILDI
jgi:hypothetical protein